jgi:predicted ester cyclase
VLGDAITHWNAGNLAGHLNMFDDRIRLHGYSPEPMDKAAVAGFYAMIWEALPAPGRPNPQLDILGTIAQGDVLACRFAMSGVHQGTFMGVSATGRAYVLPGITMIRYRDGKAIERWSSADMLGLPDPTWRAPGAGPVVRLIVARSAGGRRRRPSIALHSVVQERRASPSVRVDNGGRCRMQLDTCRRSRFDEQIGRHVRRSRIATHECGKRRP